MKKILIVAGESSTDLYGSRLIAALKEKSEKPLSIFGLGGPKMRSAGMEIIADLTGESGTGLDPLRRFSRFARTFRQLVSAVKRDKPNVAVLMDLPDFNLRLAKELKRFNIPVVYYISPQIWAWRPGRIKTISRVVDKMLVIFEFEKELYERHKVPVAFVGHPLMDVIGEIRNQKSEIRNKLGLPKDGLIIGFLPGSRKNEFVRHFPMMLKAGDLVRKQIPDCKFILGCAPNITEELVNKYTKNTDIKVYSYSNKTYEVMQASDLLITASGTATVESAIFGTPMVVVYKVSLITASVFGPLIKTPYYAMVNIIAGKQVVPELMQSEANPKRIAQEITGLLEGDNLKKASDELAEVRKKLGSPGASNRAADEILSKLVN